MKAKTLIEPFSYFHIRLLERSSPTRMPISFPSYGKPVCRVGQTSQVVKRTEKQQQQTPLFRVASEALHGCCARRTATAKWWETAVRMQGALRRGENGDSIKVSRNFVAVPAAGPAAHHQREESGVIATSLVSRGIQQAVSGFEAHCCATERATILQEAGSTSGLRKTTRRPKKALAPCLRRRPQQPRGRKKQMQVYAACDADG